jgi:site-specific DNA-methyltransferase (adenine-specific)
MKPYYQDDAVTIYHADCREVLPLLEPGSVDLVLTDPPYGIGLATDNRRFSGGALEQRARRGSGSGTAKGQPIIGDDEPFNPSFLLPYGRSHIIWGWNHFSDKLPRGACLVWIKRHDEAFGSFLSDAEIAWMSKGHGVYCHRDLSNNSITLERVHPTQKPLSLMAWCLGFFSGAQVVLDPFMGSGTTLRAAKDLGRKTIGIEIEERYCEIAAQRMQQLAMPLPFEATALKGDDQLVLPLGNDGAMFLPKRLQEQP